MEQQVTQVPYGVADFATVIEQNLDYVDKTMFIPELEKQPRNLFFIRVYLIYSVGAPGCLPYPDILFIIVL